jgi:hypothetical protein
MKKRFLGLGMLSAFLLAAPALAQNVDQKIQALEQELMQLKEQQIELKKEATEAAAAMPSFSYRPGNGLEIEAADKSWSFRPTLEAHFRMLFEEGRDQVGRTNGEIMGRRFRPGFFFCINNCLWELEATVDLDGFGTGTGKNATATDFGSILQRGALNIHLENLNPFLPTMQLGMEVQNSMSTARQGSGAVGSQAEYDLHSRNNGFNTGRTGNGISLFWDDRSLSGIGIPGRISRFNIGMGNIAEGDDGLSSFTDRKDFNTYINFQPFSQTKNMWIRGLAFEFGAWFCNHDNRAAENGCSRYRIQDHGDGGRQALFDTGAESIGDGLHIALTPGFIWNIGPYTLRAMAHRQRSEDRGGTPGRKKGDSWLIGHDLFLWSPKGFLTGSANTAGSILVGTHFERVDMEVGCNGNTGITCASVVAAGGNAMLNQFHRNRILLREVDVWYFLAPRMSIGASWLWYDASNLRTGANQAAHNLGVCDTPNVTPATGCRNGKGGDWQTLFLNWRYTF